MTANLLWNQESAQEWGLAILALEKDLISSDQFTQAVQHWVDSGEGSPLQFLQSQGELEPGDLRLLHALLAATQDPSSPSQTSAARLGETNPGGATQAFPGGLHWKQESDRFTIERPLATGGLGVVSIAFDHQLNRRVAYKELREEHLGDVVSQARFLQEAEITSRLEHPGIAPVYSLGSNPAGRPFYAMRWVEGQTWKTAVENWRADSPGKIQSRDLAFRRLVQQLIDVCRAVAYAHQQGVIHRDLKPSNVVLGKLGEAIVVDWGLAKQLNRADVSESALPFFENDETAADWELTAAGSAVGTPAYMSPEQARGAGEIVGPASDIFSLGGMLYFLLTGRPPYRAESTAKLLQLARQADFLPSSQIQPGVPPPLQAICQRAMAPHPNLRYPSAADLAADLESWLGDQPLNAYRESVLERMSRFSRNNRRLTLVAGAALVLVTLVTAVFSVRLRSQTIRAETARQAADIQAQRNAELAQAEQSAREAATRSTQLSLATLRSVILQIQRKLAPIPQAQSVRQEMLTTALNNLKQVNESLANQALKDRASMTAHNDLGMIYLISGSTQENATQAAIEQFQLADQIAVQLYEAEPDNQVACRDVSVAREHLGDAEMELGRWDQAEQAYQSALDVLIQYKQDYPDQSDLDRDLGFCWEKLGDVRMQRGQVTEGLAAYLQSNASFDRNRQAHPENLNYQRDVIVSLQKLGNVQYKVNAWEEAAATYQDCLNRIRELQSKNGGAVQPRDEQVLLNKLGDTLRQLGRMSEAVNAFQTGLNIARQIAASAPENRQAQRDLTVGLNYLAEIHAAEQKLQSAEDLLQESLRIRRELVANDSQSFAAKIDLAGALIALGKVKRQRDDSAAAKEYWREAQTIYQNLDPESLRQSPADQTQFEELQSLIGD